MVHENKHEEILCRAANQAHEGNLPIVLASTTGRTAQEMLRVLGDRRVSLIVIMHDMRRLPKNSAFDEGVAQRLRQRGDKLLMDRAPWLPSLRITRWLERLLRISGLNLGEKNLERQYGIGGKVCFLIAARAAKAGMIQEGQKVIAVAGKQAGATTALELCLEKVEPLSIVCSKTIACFNRHS
ncbi:MAG: hypothetical protein JW893_06950 [Candidatus Omnitrophica bacterium]|nr:hypothetical protein [Candidatus Omnitrophota bacterium]